MFGSLGTSEIILIVALALLLFGPRKLPEISRQIGRALGQFRKATTDFKTDLEREIRVEEIKDTERELKSVGREISREVDSAASEAADPVGPSRVGSNKAPGKTDDEPIPGR